MSLDELMRKNQYSRIITRVWSFVFIFFVFVFTQNVLVQRVLRWEMLIYLSTSLFFAWSPKLRLPVRMMIHSRALWVLGFFGLGMCLGVSSDLALDIPAIVSSGAFALGVYLMAGAFFTRALLTPTLMTGFLQQVEMPDDNPNSY